MLTNGRSGLESKAFKILNMIEVFTIDTQNRNQANEVLELLQQNYPTLRINFDFGDWESSTFACRDKVLRIEGSIINPHDIISTVAQSGFRCRLLPDKICK